MISIKEIILPQQNDNVGVVFFVSQEMQGEGIDKSMAFLCMSHDDASGVISLENNLFDITWERVGFDRNFADVNQALEKITGLVSE